MSRGHALGNVESLVRTPWQLTSMQSGHNIVKISLDDLLNTRKYDRPIFSATSQMISIILQSLYIGFHVLYGKGLSN